MPQIIVEYDLETLDDEQLGRLDSNLAYACSSLLSTAEWLVKPDAFGFKPEKIVPPARSTHNVIVRIVLHEFPERLELASEHALIIMETTCAVLTSYGHPDGVTVGVSLGYMHVEWSAGVLANGLL